METPDRHNPNQVIKVNIIGNRTKYVSPGRVQWKEHRTVSMKSMSTMPNLNIIMKEPQPSSNWGTLTDFKGLKHSFPVEGSWRDMTSKRNTGYQPGYFCHRGCYWDNWQNLNGVWGLDDSDKSIFVSRFWWLSCDYRRMSLFVRNPHSNIWWWWGIMLATDTQKKCSLHCTLKFCKFEIPPPKKKDLKRLCKKVE